MNAKIEVELQDAMGNDAAIANAAWTSTYDKIRREDNYDNPAKVEALVARLINEGHSVPLESVIFRFWIRHPIFNDRQHMTHRIASHNGLSGRYRTLPKDWYSLPQDVLAIADKVNRRAGNRLKDAFDEECERQHRQYTEWLEFFKKAEKAAVITNGEYKRARELIRGVLGTAFMVERTTILNLRSFANYQRLRNSDHAQAEIKSVAVQMLEQVKAAEICPVAIATLEANGWKI